MSREIALWRVVIRRPLADATCDLAQFPAGRDRESLMLARNDARAWLNDRDEDFQEVCGLAALEPGRLEAHVRGLKASGWRKAGARGERSLAQAARQTFKRSVVLVSGANANCHGKSTGTGVRHITRLCM